MNSEWEIRRSSPAALFLRAPVSLDDLVAGKNSSAIELYSGFEYSIAFTSTPQRGSYLAGGFARNDEDTWEPDLVRTARSER